MSIDLMTRVWWRQDLDPSEKLVMLALADRADDEDGVCWYAVDTLARKTSLQRRSVQRIIARLVDHGLLRKRHRHDRSNYYIIPVDKFPYPEKLDRPRKERGPSDFLEAVEPDLFPDKRGDGESPRRKNRGDSGSVRGDPGSVRGDPRSPNPLYDSNMIPDSLRESATEEGLSDMIIRLWNELAERHAAIAPFTATLTEDRKTKIGLRTKRLVEEFPDVDEREAWACIIKRVGSSKLLTGQKTSWAATFDWMLGPKNFEKIIGGNYGHGHDSIDGPAGPGDRSAVAAGAEAMRLVTNARQRRGQVPRSGGHQASSAGAHR